MTIGLEQTRVRILSSFNCIQATAEKLRHNCSYCEISYGLAVVGAVPCYLFVYQQRKYSVCLKPMMRGNTHLRHPRRSTLLENPQ